MKNFLASIVVLSALAWPGAASAVDLTVAGLTVTQATQSEDQAIPLVADRRAFVRVFVVADAENSLRPKVRLQFVYGRKIKFQTTFEPPRELGGVPLALVRNDHGKSWNVTVPAAWIKPGLKLIAEVDPDRRVRESNESNNLWPSKAGQAFDVRNPPPLKVTFVPVRLPDGRTSQITAKNVDSFITYSRRVLPVPEKIDVVIHKPFTTTADVIVFEGWIQLINEIEALRVAERTRDRHYASLVDPGAPGAVGGLGFLGGFTTVSTEWTRPLDEGRLTYREFVIGHELGHNLSLPHAPCGNVGSFDPNFPYEQAGIGRNGFDVFLNRAYTPESGAVDLMSYCRVEPWISDYNYLKVMSYRGQLSTRPRRAEAEAVAVEGEGLLVWGRETPSGWLLEPAFRVRGVTEAASAVGSEIELLDPSGRVAVSHGVRLYELDHLPGRVFAALVPLDGTVDPAAIRLKVDGRVVAERRGGGQEPAHSALTAAARALRTADDTVLVTWDAVAQPMALLRDADSGEILGFARGGRLELGTRTARLEILLSTGVDSVQRTFELP